MIFITFSRKLCITAALKWDIVTHTYMSFYLWGGMVYPLNKASSHQIRVESLHIGVVFGSSHPQGT